MKKFLLCLIFLVMSAAAAFGGEVKDFINEVLKTQGLEGARMARALVTDEKIGELINSGDDINVRGQRGDTLLMLAAAFNNNPQVIRNLIKAGADVNAKNYQGWTALMSALADDSNNNAKIIKILVEAGADVKAKNDRGITASDLAKRKQNPEIRELAETLLFISENPTAELLNMIKDSRTTTTQIKTLLNLGADINAKDKSGNTVFMHAAKYNSNVEVIKMLVASGADINAKNNKGQTAEDLAKKNPNILIQKMAGVLKWVNDLDKALVDSITENAAPDTIGALIELGANVKVKDDNGKTLLMTAAEKTNYPEVIKILVKAGLDVNEKTRDGQTALNYAAKFNKNSEIVRTLVNYSAEEK